MATSFPNVYTHRKVADTAAKGCDICFRPSTSVLITPEKQSPIDTGSLTIYFSHSPPLQDFFYVCPSHLKDRGFCTPIVDQSAIEAKKKKELEDEIARVKQEYEERQKKKKEGEKESDKEKQQEKEKEKKEDKDKKSDTDNDTKSEPSESSKPNREKASMSFGATTSATPMLTECGFDEIQDKTDSEATTAKEDEEPRVFALHRFVSCQPAPIPDVRSRRRDCSFPAPSWIEDARLRRNGANTDVERSPMTGDRNFYTQRLDKKRQAEMAKRNRERMRDPSFFPSVPKDLP